MDVAILGLGYWAEKLISAAGKVDNFNIAYSYDINPDRKYTGIENRPLDNILSNDNIAAVLIATPPETHFELSKQALEAGKHVFCEKPLALSSKEASALCDISEKKKLILAVDHTFLFTEEVRQFKQIIELDKYGKPLLFRSTRANYGKFSNVGVFWDLAIHDISIVNYLFGVPDYVSATGFKNNDRYEDGNISLLYRDNFRVNIHVSWLNSTKDRRMELITEKGVISTSFTNGIFLSKYEEPTPKVLFNSKSNVSPLETELNHFAECIRQKKNGISSGAKGFWAVKVIEKVLDSASHNGAERGI